jgi:hypothetical protein
VLAIPMQLIFAMLAAGWFARRASNGNPEAATGPPPPAAGKHTLRLP